MDAFICDGVRTPIGRYGGALSSIRADDLAALPIKALIERHPQLNLGEIDDVMMGCANQAGEDNRNVARMSALLAGLPVTVSGVTLNRLCGSGMDAVGSAARAIKSGELDLIIASGVENMSRAPFVMPKASTPFSRANELFDTTMGWRFVNERMKEQYGVETMPETAENVAEQFDISRERQDVFALWSQNKTEAAQKSGFFSDEIISVAVPQRKGASLEVNQDEHPRAGTTYDKLAKLGTPFRQNGTVTAGNASGINDGACALIIASEKAAKNNGLTPKTRICAMATTGVEPRFMGMGPVSASQKVLEMVGLSLDQMSVIEINEAFAAQAVAVMGELGLADDDTRINPNGGAISLGHPLGMSGARLVLTASNQLHHIGGQYALCTMCIGVGQGIALILERV